MSKMSRVRRKKRIAVSETYMFRIPSMIATTKRQTTVAGRTQEKNGSASVKKLSLDPPKTPRMNSQDMRRFCAATMDILQPTSYFPKPRAVGHRMFECKSPERLVGVQDKRTVNVFDLVDMSAESSSSNVDWTTFQGEMLSIHNKLRSAHNVPPLKLDKELCLLAFKRAILLASNCKQDENEAEGKNVYVFTKLKRLTEAREACESWYKEGKKYQYDAQKSLNAHNRHFTQMIWAETTLLGAGMAKGNGKTYIVTIYMPKGNISGKYLTNVFKPNSSDKVFF